MGFAGMDVAQAEAHARLLEERHGRLIELFTDLDAQVSDTQAAWIGPDGDAFRAQWTAEHATRFRPVAENLLRAASELDQHIEEQNRASGAGDSTGSGDTGAGAPDGADIADPTAHDPGGDRRGNVDPDVYYIWTNMTHEQRMLVAQEIVDEQFAQYGMDPVEISFENSDNMGSWREGFLIFGDKLVINKERLDDPAIIHTLIHEVRHAAQHEFIEQTDRSLWDHITGDDKSAEYERIEEEHGVTREEIEAWDENFGDRTPAPTPLPENPTPEDEARYQEEYDEYFEQPTEADAQATGRDWVNDLTAEDMQEYQERAGVPVTEVP